jgi:hypothetical protein
MKYKLAVTVLASALIATPAMAFTEPFPGSYRETRDITCPAQYPIKTGEGVMGGGYITTCWTQQAWNLQMAGGDDWTAWLNGTYVPAPTPTPTVTVTPAPVVIERVVSGGTQIVVQEVPAAKPDTSTRKAIRAEIKRLKAEVKRLERKFKKMSKK